MTATHVFRTKENFSIFFLTKNQIDIAI